ncbi:phage major capsid protein [Sediminibacillus terrae]|uniref:phage major capsid protein n=1 Tax=Sediminibacillus terrae TaxID=1562106 RepID=UPI001EFFBC63|nr:phage major capsid protein [Sediminibacillus terrae]
MKTRLNGKQTEIRTAFANYVAGKISTREAQSFGISLSNDGKALIPKVVADEIVGYVEQENLLRKYGKVVEVEGNLQYPVLTEDTDIKVDAHTGVRNEEIEVNSIGLTAELLTPVEFDSLSRVKRKLLMSGKVSLADLIIDLMKREYLKKEIDYMFNGNNEKAINTGSLLNKAKVFTPTQTDPVKIIKELKNTPTSNVINKARWIVNKPAIKYVEDLILPNGEAALKTLDRVDGGVSYMLLGFPLDFTDAVKGDTQIKAQESVENAEAELAAAQEALNLEPTNQDLIDAVTEAETKLTAAQETLNDENENTAVFYFGDFSSFKIQEDPDGLEIQTINSLYAHLNEVGFKLYNLVDGKLIYSQIEPTIYRLEV